MLSTTCVLQPISRWRIQIVTEEDMWKIHGKENIHHITYLLFLKSMDFLKVGTFKWGLFLASFKMLYEKRPAALVPLPAYTCMYINACGNQELRLLSWCASFLYFVIMSSIRWHLHSELNIVHPISCTSLIIVGRWILHPLFHPHWFM